MKIHEYPESCNSANQKLFTHLFYKSRKDTNKKPFNHRVDYLRSVYLHEERPVLETEIFDHFGGMSYMPIAFGHTCIIGSDDDLVSRLCTKVRDSFGGTIQEFYDSDIELKKDHEKFRHYSALPENFLEATNNGQSIDTPPTYVVRVNPLEHGLEDLATIIKSCHNVIISSITNLKMTCSLQGGVIGNFVARKIVKMATNNDPFALYKVAALEDEEFIVIDKVCGISPVYSMREKAQMEEEWIND